MPVFGLLDSGKGHNDRNYVSAERVRKFSSALDARLQPGHRIESGWIAQREVAPVLCDFHRYRMANALELEYKPRWPARSPSKSNLTR